MSLFREAQVFIYDILPCYLGGMGGLQNMMKQFQGASSQMGGAGPSGVKGRKK